MNAKTERIKKEEKNEIANEQQTNVQRKEE